MDVVLGLKNASLKTLFLLQCVAYKGVQIQRNKIFWKLQIFVYAVKDMFVYTGS